MDWLTPPKTQMFLNLTNEKSHTSYQIADINLTGVTNQDHTLNLDNVPRHEQIN